MADRKRPTEIKVAGITYKIGVFQVTEFDGDGSPRTFRRLKSDEKVDLEGGEHFHIFYVREDHLGSNTEREQN